MLPGIDRVELAIAGPVPGGIGQGLGAEPRAQRAKTAVLTEVLRMGLGSKTKTRVENLIAWVIAALFVLLLAAGAWFLAAKLGLVAAGGI